MQQVSWRSLRPGAPFRSPAEPPTRVIQVSKPSVRAVELNIGFPTPVQESRTLPLKVAVVGTGIAGLSAAWLLSPRHHVKVFERERRIGGHCYTVNVDGDSGPIPVDMGFIVYNETNYPNLCALFEYLDVATDASDMSFAVSLDDGRFEYSSAIASGLFAQKRNIVRPYFWSMLRDVYRFYREAPRDLPLLDDSLTIGAYLDRGRYGAEFRRAHLLPMAAAIWSAPTTAILNYPAAAFLRFYQNHGLLRLANRAVWRTVRGGSRSYVQRLANSLRVEAGCAVSKVRRIGSHVEIRTSRGETERYDHVVVATHADDALGLLDDPSVAERRILRAFSYSENLAVLHNDEALMPRRRSAWASWNFIGSRGGDGGKPCTVSYWMNRLQNLQAAPPLFVTLNPDRCPAPKSTFQMSAFKHPLYDPNALQAQRDLWDLQGVRNTWFCGSYFGSGFHEDALQSGLAVAEDLGGVRRPWNVADEDSRIHRKPRRAASVMPEVAA